MTHNGQGPEQQHPAAQGGPMWSAAQPLPPEATPGGPSDAQATQYLPPVPAQPPAPPTAPPAGYGYPPAPQQGGGYGYPPAPQAPQQGYGYPPAPQPQQPPQQSQPQQPQAQQQPQPGYGYPGPAAPASDAQATQYLPPVAPVPPPGGDSQATQMIPPIAGVHGGPGAPGAGPDMQATQYIAPVPPQGPAAQGPGQVPGERPPLADFDNLFRSETPQQAPAPHHQAPAAPYQPPVQNHQPTVGLHHQPPQPPQQQYGQQPPQQYGGFQDAYYDDGAGAEPEPPRRRSPIALIAAVVAACAVIGLGAGALLSGGDEDDKKDAKGGQNVAASSAAPSGQATEKAADPAEAQAKALDKLLADSNNSRDAVIRSVEAIKNCTNLDQAATDLRGAAEQRRGLVTRLQSLTVDQVPNNAALTAALTKAWQASASADDHYAAWADQMKGKKACKGGKARSTSQTVEANKKSAEATNAKRQAAGLWNPTAEKYELTKRQPTQL
ncbi:hypothetical protein ACIGEZ_13540 [Streptomyces sp. NPDC085481]|uniref:hypothetical protein n=1 Tax=Streptomyces sp. NPDC085481 TaxID=3365727 RepID=UPI0037CFD990